MPEQTGAIGGLNLSITGKKLLYTKDVTEYESSNYRQLDTRIFEYNFNTAATLQITTEKIGGTNDLDARYSPNEAEVIFVNTSNDGVSEKNILKMELYISGNAALKREVLFSGNFMPDWE